MPKRESRDAVVLSVKLDKDVAKALSVYAAMQDEYMYRVLESFIREGLKRKGKSVEELAAA